MAEDRSKPSAELGSYSRGVVGTVDFQEIPTDFDLIVLRAAERECTSDDQDFEVRTCGGLGTSTATFRGRQYPWYLIRVPGRVVSEIGAAPVFSPC